MKSWFAGTASSVNSEIITPFSNAEQIIYKYNQAIEHNSLTQQGWQRLIAQCDDGLASYLTNIKGSIASMSAYSVSLQGNITGYTKITQAMKQYNALGAVSQKEQQNFATAVSLTNAKLGSYLTGLNGAKASLSGYGVSLIASTAKTVGLTIATTALNAALTFGISAIITGVVSAFATWINSSKEITEAAEEAKDKIASINDDLKTNTETVENAKQRYAELAQEVENLGKVNQSRGSLSTDEYEEFLDLSNQLADVFPQLSKNYDDNGNAILNLSGDVDTIVGSLDDLLQKEKDLANQKIIDEFPDVYKGYVQDLSKAESEVKSAKSEFDKINNAYQQLQNSGGMVQAFDKDSLLGTFENEDGEEATVELANYIQALEDLNIAYEKTNITRKNAYGGDEVTGYLITATGDIDTAFTSKLETARKNLQYAEQQLEGEKSSIDSYLNTWLQSEFTYNQIDDSGLQTAVQDMIMNFDFSSLPDNIDKNDWNAVSEYLRRNILFAINDVQDDPEISKAISEVFTNQDLTPDEKADYLKQIKDYFDNELGKDNAINISLQPKIDDTDALQKNYQKTLERFKSDASDPSSKELDSLNKQLDEQTQNLTDAKENLQNEYDKISDWGLDDYADQIKNNTIQTKFGNVDMDKRTIIHWSDELKQTYADALASWDYDPEVGSIDTVFGGSERFGEELNGNGWEVAFTPILPDGTFLSKDTVEEYINSILEEAYADDGKVTDDELKKIDEQGLQIGNTFVKGIYAGIDDSQNYDDNGNWAETVGRLMHFSGKFGAKQLADQEIDDANVKLEETKKKIEEVSKGFDDSKKIKDFFDTEGINTDEEIDEFNKVTEGIKRADKAIQTWNEHKKESKKTPISSFSEAWKSLTSDTKKSLTELAKAGQLTEKTFSKISGADDFAKSLKSLGLTTDDVIQKINKMQNSADQLSAMKSGISAISNILATKKENLSSKKTQTEGIGADVLAGLPDEVKSSKQEYEEFCKVLGDGNSDMQKCKRAANDLATAYVNSNNFLSNLNSTNQDYYESVLKEMGVENAHEITESILGNTIDANTRKKLEAKAANIDFTNVTANEITELQNYGKQLKLTTNEINTFIIRQAFANNNPLNPKTSIENLAALRSSLNLTGKKLEYYNKLMQAENVLNASRFTSIPKDEVEKAKKNIAKYQKKLEKKDEVKIDIKPLKSNKSNNNNSNKKTSNSKSSSKQTIDWIARAIDVLNNKLDLANAKYNNLTSLKGKKNNLAKQIRYTTRLINAEKVALSKYTAQYKAVKLDGKLKTAVKKGRLRGTRKQLIATYGEKTANKIQKYQDLYDKAQTARTAIQTQRKNRTDKRKERLQLDVDDADARSSLADARIENNTSAKAKNVQEEKKYKSTKKSYDYQIKIAKLEKDNVKVATLRAQKEKALLDIRVQEKQNLADENEATYNLNQQLETNAVGYKNKNLYETRSRESLKSQYSYLIEIAKLQSNITEQKRLEAELREKTQSSYMQEINNIKDDYNNRTSLNESDISTNQSKIEKLQAEGLRVSSNFYATNMAINANKRQTLVEEMSQLQSHMNTLTPYSSDWYSTVQDINTIAQNIDTCDKNTVEWQQAINDLELSKFQLINSQLESTINHLDFLIDMIDEADMFGKDSGNITDAGITALSLYIDKMNETSESIKNKRAEWSKFQEQVARGTSGYDEKTIQDKNEEYASSLRNLIKTNKEVEDSITSIVENGLNKQKDALDDIISKYKQALDRASELRDYQKDVADQTKNINSIEKRIKALSGNDLSEEARARIQKLTVELNDAKDNLQDTQYARWKTDQENMLDDLSDSFEQSITDALANTDSIIEAVQMLVADNGSTVKAYLESMGFGGDSNIVGTKYASNGAYNSTFSTYDGNYVRYNYDMNGNLLSVDTLDSGGNMISSLQNTNSSTNGSSSASTSTAPTNTSTAPTVSNTSPANTSQVSLADTIATWVNKHGREATSSDASRIARDPVLAYLNDHSNRTKKFMISNNEEYELAKLLSSHDSKLAQAISDSKGINPKNMSDKFKRLIAKALKNAGYANGGVVSGLKGAIRANGDSLIATVNPRESILTEEFTNMLPKAVDIMSNFNTLPSLIPKSILNNRSVSQDIKIGDINVTVDAPNAYDANGITQAIKQSTALQKTLQDATVGQVSKSFNNKLSI